MSKIKELAHEMDLAHAAFTAAQGECVARSNNWTQMHREANLLRVDGEHEKAVEMLEEANEYEKAVEAAETEQAAAAARLKNAGQDLLEESRKLCAYVDEVLYR